MVNNPPRMHEFQSHTFACIRFKNFLLLSLYSTNQLLLTYIRKPNVESLWRVTKASCLATIPHQCDGPTNLIAVTLGCLMRCKSHFSESHFHYYIHTYIYIYKTFCFKTFMQGFSILKIVKFKSARTHTHRYIHTYCKID